MWDSMSCQESMWQSTIMALLTSCTSLNIMIWIWMGISSRECPRLNIDGQYLVFSLLILITRFWIQAICIISKGIRRNTWSMPLNSTETRLNLSITMFPSIQLAKPSTEIQPGTSMPSSTGFQISINSKSWQYTKTMCMLSSVQSPWLETVQNKTEQCMWVMELMVP